MSIALQRTRTKEFIVFQNTPSRDHNCLNYVVNVNELIRGHWKYKVILVKEDTKERIDCISKYFKQICFIVLLTLTRINR